MISQFTARHIVDSPSEDLPISVMREKKKLCIGSTNFLISHGTNSINFYFLASKPLYTGTSLPSRSRIVLVPSSTSLPCCDHIDHVNPS